MFAPFADAFLTQLGQKCLADTGVHDDTSMDAQAIRRAALITVRRAICERFPPDPERRGAAQVASESRQGCGASRRKRTRRVATTLLPL